MQSLLNVPIDTVREHSCDTGDMSLPETPLIVGLGGTMRTNSSSERALRISLRAAEMTGARTLLISGPQLVLPFYKPNTSKHSTEVKHLVEALRRCNGLIISAAAYHGTVSGLLKNALDYVEDLRDDGRCYLDGIAVGCIACGAGWQAAVHRLAVLRTFVHCLRCWPTPFGAVVMTS